MCEVCWWGGVGYLKGKKNAQVFAVMEGTTPKKKERNGTTKISRIDFIFPSFKTTHTTLFWFLGDTQGARFYDKHGTTLHLFVILFPVQYMEKRFALETKLFDKN